LLFTPVFTTDVALTCIPTRRSSDLFIRIHDAHDRRVVTVIEVLSPSNKRGGPDRTAYLAKRNEYLGGKLNLVEIDLLRGGQRMRLEEHTSELQPLAYPVCRYLLEQK